MKYSKSVIDVTTTQHRLLRAMNYWIHLRNNCPIFLSRRRCRRCACGRWNCRLFRFVFGFFENLWSYFPLAVRVFGFPCRISPARTVLFPRITTLHCSRLRVPRRLVLHGELGVMIFSPRLHWCTARNS